MQSVTERHSRAVFTALAQTNAEFFHDSRISLSGQMAGYVSRMLNVRTFIRRGRDLLPEPDSSLAAYRETLLHLGADQGVTPIGREFEAIAASVDGDDALLLVRPAEHAFSLHANSETMPRRRALSRHWLPMRMSESSMTCREA